MPIATSPFGLPWAMLDRDARHTGHGNTVGPEDPSVLGAPWPYQTGGPIASQAAIDYSGVAYVGSEDGWIHAVGFNGQGSPLYDAGSPIRVSPALIGEATAIQESYVMVPPTIYFGSDDGQLFSILGDGTLRWVLAPGATPNQSPVRSSPVIDPLSNVQRWIYAGADNGRLYATFESTPTQAVTAWERTVSRRPLRSSPALSPQGDRLYVGTPEGRLHCLDALNGSALANTPVNTGGGPLTTPTVDSTGNVYVAGRSGILFAFDDSGGAIWQVSLGGNISAPPTLGVRGEILVIAENTLYAVSATGAILWSEAFSNRLLGTAPIVDSSGTAYVSSNDGWVFGVRRHPTAAGTRLTWSVEVDPAGPALTTPTLDAYGRIYVGASDSRLYAIDEAPAFQITFHSDLSASPNFDVHSLREIYGVLDPARTLRLTDHPALDQQPAYSLDRSVLAYVSDRDGSEDVFLATAIATDEENLTGSAFPPTSAETEPAFTPINDLTGVSRPPHHKPYLALTSDMSGLNRLVFIDLEAQAGGTLTWLRFTHWAASLGVPSTITQVLEPPDTEQSQIAFSSDGKKVAWRHCEPAHKTGQVELLILKGSTWQLSDVGPKYYYDPESPLRCGDEPCFSPDSRWIALREGPSLAIYDVFGQQAPLFSVSQSPVGEPRHPNWSPDGSEIAVGLDTGTMVDVFVASGQAYGTYSQLTSSRTSDEPYYHQFKMPPPRDLRLNPDRQFPGAEIEILGRGFDILHPENNKVFFADTQQGPLREAEVLGASVNPYQGLGVIKVRVPDLAGHGAITVETRFGSASTTQTFYVLPKPAKVVQPRSVVGAKVRVFGVGFDLTTANQHTVSFTGAAGGFVTAQALSGGLEGTQEYLIVQVPPGIAETGSIRVDNTFGGSPCPSCTFTQLHPKFSIRRTTGLPEYALQGSAGVTVRIEGSDFPFDPFFGYGESPSTPTARVDVLGLPPSVPPIRQLAFVPDGTDTATFGPDDFQLPGISPGGDLSIKASDANLPSANAVAPFRIPLTDVPIIFVPGTSGSSLDLAPGAAIPDPITQPADFHYFPWISKTQPEGMLAHVPWTFDLNPGPSDPRGPRVWIGPEAITTILAGTPLGNQGNHYLDALAFTGLGVPRHSEIVPGTVLNDVTIAPAANVTIGPASVTLPTLSHPQYKPLIDFLTRSNGLGWTGRPLCTSTDPATGNCIDVSTGLTMSGHNAVYLFNLDWRESIPTQQLRLSAFVDAVLGRADVMAAGVKKVGLITHSYGGPVARGYYLDPVNVAEQKVDQVISLGGGFLGVVAPLEVLEKGSTWDLGISLGAFSLGLAEWETQALAQDWPTAYFQLPNSEDWFFDHGTTMNGMTVNRSYIRDNRALPGPWGLNVSLGAGEIATYDESMNWIANRHNAPGPFGMTDGLSRAQTLYFNPASGPLGMGDFRHGTGAIYHHRIIGKGIVDTTVATLVELKPSEAWKWSWLSPADELIEAAPTEWRTPVQGDGDHTIPYHGALGLTSATDDRVYILDDKASISGAKHSDLPNLPEVIGRTGVGTPPVMGLLQMLLEGSICSQPQAPAFMSQNDVTEII